MHQVDEQAGIGAAAIAVAQAALRGGQRKKKEASTIGAEWGKAKRCLKLVVPEVTDPPELYG